MWQNRQPIDRRHIRSTHHQYDADFNLLVRERGPNGITQVYKTDSAFMKTIPCAQMERLVHHVSVDHHQALMVYHAILQGNIIIIT